MTYVADKWASQENVAFEMREVSEERA